MKFSFVQKHRHVRWGARSYRSSKSDIFILHIEAESWVEARKKLETYFILVDKVDPDEAHLDAQDIDGVDAIIDTDMEVAKVNAADVLPDLKARLDELPEP